MKKLALKVCNVGAQGLQLGEQLLDSKCAEGVAAF
jgi:hypothetical protein